MRSLVLLPIIAALALLLAAPPAPARADVSVFVGVNFGPPPPLPVYVQPPVPGPNYIWSPGYWAWGPYGYYWVPGTWVLAPAVGLLWTPGYWAFNDDAYVWYPGYWAPNVGFYGGVVYGFGYFGVGYVGGYWDGDAFRYNVAVTNVNTVIVRNVYFDRAVVVNRSFDRVSYDGGTRGLRAHPTWREDAVRYFERHDPPTAAQVRNERFAAANRNYLASVNRGRPAIAVVDRPLSRSNNPGFATIRSQDRLAARQRGGSSTARWQGSTHQTARHLQGGSHTQTFRQSGWHTQTYRQSGSHTQTYGQSGSHAQTYRRGGSHLQTYGQSRSSSQYQRSYSAKPVTNSAYQTHANQQKGGSVPNGHPQGGSGHHGN